MELTRVFDTYSGAAVRPAPARQLGRGAPFEGTRCGGHVSRRNSDYIAADFIRRRQQVRPLPYEPPDTKTADPNVQLDARIPPRQVGRRT